MSLASLPFPSLNNVGKPQSVDSMIADLVKMTPEQRQQFAQQHMSDPISLSAAKYVDNQIKDQAQKMMQPQGPMPPVNQTTAQSIGQPTPPSQPMMSNAPQPAPVNQMQNQMQSQAQQPAAMVQQSATPPMMAANGGAMYSLPENSGIANLPTRMNFAEGGIVGYDKGGTIQYAGSDPFGAAIAAEGINDPTQLAFLKSIYGQESGGGANTTTSNRGAVGGMQIVPSTFNSVADPSMDINNPVDNARAGIRYALQGYNAAGGDPVLAGAYYYGGPSGMNKAKQGVAVSDSKNPQSPNTLQYGQSIAARMANLLPIGSAQAETLPEQKRKMPSNAATPNSAYDEDASQSDPMNFYVPQQGGQAVAPIYTASSAATPTGPQKPWYDRAREALTTGEGQRQMLLGLGDIPYDIAGAPADIGSTIGKALGYQSGESSLGSENLKRLGTKYLGREADAPDTVLQGLRTTGGVAGLMFNPTGAISKLGNARNLRLAENAIQAQKEAEAAQTGVSLPRLENPAGNQAMVANSAGDISTAGRVSSVDAALSDQLRARNLADIARTNSAAAQGTLTPAQYAALNARAARSGDVMRGTAAAGQIPQAAQGVSDAMNNLNSPSASGAYIPGSNMLPDPAQQRGQGRMPDTTPAEITAPSAVAAASAQEKAKADPSALSSDDWLALAAGLLSNKSQYASEALGSGLGSLVAGRAARGKMAMEQQKMAAEAEELAQRGRYYGAQADIQPQKAQMWSDKAASMAQGITDKLTLGKMSNLIAEGKQLHSAIPGTPEGIAAQARLSQISNELASLRGSAPVAQNTPMTGFTVTPRG